MKPTDKLASMLYNIINSMHEHLAKEVYFYKPDIRSKVLKDLAFVVVVCKEELIINSRFIEVSSVKRLIKDIDDLIVEVLTEMSKMNPDSVYLSTYVTKEYYEGVAVRIEKIVTTYRS